MTRAPGPYEIPGHLTSRRMVDLGDAHPHVDLDGTEYRQGVDHASLIASIGAGDRLGLRRGFRGGNRARHHEVVAGGLHTDTLCACDGLAFSMKAVLRPWRSVEMPQPSGGINSMRAKIGHLAYAINKLTDNINDRSIEFWPCIGPALHSGSFRGHPGN